MHLRRTRVTGALLACLLSWQMGSAAAAALARSAAPGCCCGHYGEHRCHCPTCAHGRASESNERQVRSCGDSGTALIAADARPCLPAQPAVDPPLRPLPLPRSCAAAPQLPPAPDVPTPPPLG